jgi:acyl-CoA reductase-like NAD-dependent aldehyde dehydrogenase
VIGPLIDMRAVEKVEADIADALKKGAKIFTGRKCAALGGQSGEIVKHLRYQLSAARIACLGCPREKLD